MMSAHDLHDKILGCLTTAGMADAMGGPSEAMSYNEIIMKFGGPISSFLPGPEDSIYAKGNIPGEVTDDTSQMYEMAKAIIKSNGNLTVRDAADALVNWSENYTKYYPRNAGQTTRFVIEDLKNGGDPETIGRKGGTYNRGTSNGAAMRIAAAGLINPDNMEGAIKTAIIMTKPSHGTQHAYSGACSIACGIAKGLAEDADIFTVLKSCIYGAERGEMIGKQEARIAPGPKLLPKILKAINVALITDGMEETLMQLEANVGNDGSIQTSVAAAIGIFAATKGDTQKTMLYGANLGGDTDTIGCIAGMLSGAYSGFSSIPPDLYNIFVKANPELDFIKISKELSQIAIARD
jgi:ADP-ribosylglycohydrolase